MIEILKASAGSGKTFQLAKTYISLLLASDDMHAYRHILAVTFTNKATEEMKSRILKELDILARCPSQSGYYAEFSRKFGPDEVLRERAGKLLVGILHDYGAFAVSTIDRFFQRTLKAFAREIGQFASYQVELDKQSLVHESVDRILDALTEADRDLLKWLTESVVDRLEQDGRYNLESQLYEMADALKSDEYREIVEAAGIDEKKVYSKDNLRAVREGCQKFMAQYSEQVAAAAHAVLDVLDGAGVDPGDTTRGFLRKLESYAALGPKDRPALPTDSWMESARNPEKWFPKTKAKALLPRVQGSLERPLEAFCDLFGLPWKVFNTASVLSGQIYSLGIAGELYREFDALVKEKNVMSLDDSNVILSRIIAGSDAPFVYEKLGVRFEDFLLDEFQDTSMVQWKNFLPLLRESHAGGRENLIVGDVKQSIYRWRGSDWNLLDSEIVQDFPGAGEHTLTQNWRSCRTIVEFNNGFFAFAADRLDRQLRNGKRLISDIYADVAQTPKTQETAPGSVRFTFCDPEEELAAVLDSVRAAREAGAEYGHVAVLVRSNAAGSEVAGYLVDNGIPVISDDSLRVKSSVTVRRLVSLLSHADKRSDKVAGYLADSLDLPVPDAFRSLTDLAEALLRNLRRKDEAAFDGEVLHIQSFMDELQDWTAVHGNNLGAFLKAWDEADPKISSPDGTDAVRIMTIHKSKGLEFPYVIFPFAESVGLFRPQIRWSRPELGGTPLEDFADGAYRVTLSKETDGTLFAKDFERERLYQYIDNINTFYVAMTRPEKGLHVIASTPSDKCVAACAAGDDSYEFKNFSELLYRYVRDKEREDGGAPEGDDACDRMWGELFDFRSMPPSGRTQGRPAGYPSFPLNPDPGDASGDVRVRGRLKCTADSVDFFREGAMSARLKGLVLHDILSRTVVPEDLDKAVEAALCPGMPDAEEADRYRSFLACKIDGVRERGWFPDDPSRVRNERAVIGTDGREYRPDRVVVTPRGTQVIDFKFGAEESGHRRQVLQYVRLYEEMGYGPVRGFLWYLREEGPDKIVEL